VHYLCKVVGFLFNLGFFIENAKILDDALSPGIAADGVKMSALCMSVMTFLRAV